MANTLDAAVDRIFGAYLEPLREAAVMPMLVRNRFEDEIARQGDAIRFLFDDQPTVEDAVPSHEPIQAEDRTVDAKLIPLNEWKRVKRAITDKEVHEIAMDPHEFAANEARALANHVNGFLLNLYQDIVNYVGTAGTAPFASDVNELIDAGVVMSDGACPPMDRHFVVAPKAEGSLLKLSAVQRKDNRSPGAEDSLSTGNAGMLVGFNVEMDQQSGTSHTSGSGTKMSAAAAVVGATSVAVDGAGTIAKGDLIRFGASGRYYVARAAVAGGAGIVDIYPGLEAAVADNTALQRIASHEVSLAFQRGFAGFASRPVIRSSSFTGGNIVRTYADRKSGIAYTVEMVRQSHQTLWVSSILFGGGVLRPECACRVIG